MEEKEIDFNGLNKRLCKEFEIEPLKKDFIKIYTPFQFDDGDQISIGISLKDGARTWHLTDGSDTFLHLSNYFGQFKFYKGPRKELINKFLQDFSVVLKEGALFKSTDQKNFSYDFFDFIQCIFKLSNITIIEPEIVEKTFQYDLKNRLRSYLIDKGYNLNRDFIFDYYNDFDEKKSYKIDCFIKTKSELIYIFAIGSGYTCQNATISILTFEKKGIVFHPVAFFKDQTKIQPKMVAQLTDAVEKSISGLEKFDIFSKYFESYLSV